MAVSNKYAKRRRNAVLAAVAMALVFIVIVIVIIVSVANPGKKEPSKSTPTPTINGGFPTLPTNPPAKTTAPAGNTPTGSIVTPTPDLNAGTIMYVTGTTVNVRESASTSSDKISSLAKGSAVTAYEKVEGFYRVKLSDGKTGYISADYLSETDPKASPSPSTAPTTTPDTSTGTKMYVTGDSVNVRKAASATGERITSLNKGKEVIAYASKDGWTYIDYGSNGTKKYGYISSSFLSATEPSGATNKPTLNPSATVSPTGTAIASPTMLPSPTARVYESFTELGVADKVADVADTLGDGNGEFYIKSVKSRTGVTINADPAVYSYYKFATHSGDTIYLVFKGTEAAPTSINIQSAAPANPT
jgi:uncharacterized protein YgiM (DUF1202 family)